MTSTVAFSGVPSGFFAAYFTAFNCHDLETLAPFWSPDCLFRTRPGFPDLRGRSEICRFYRDLWAKADETITLRGLSAEDGFVLAEIETAIVARENMPEFGLEGLAVNDRLHLHSVVAYRLSGQAICSIEGRAVLSRQRVRPEAQSWPVLGEA